MSQDTRRILAVQALRAFAYGLGSVVVGATLAASDLGAVGVGLVLGAILAGAALVSLALGRYGDRFGRRRAYRLLLVAMAIAGAVFALTDALPALLLAALTGTVSTEVLESGPFTSLEQAMLPSAAGGEDPTRLFGVYNTVATLAGSLGALAAGGPTLVQSTSAHWLLVYPAAAALAFVPAARLTSQVEAPGSAGDSASSLSQSRSIVRRLAGLFALDSFGGGFVPQTFIVYLFTRKYGASLELLGVVFFAVGILQALSFQAAVRLADRIGLLRTMVFTHLPSNLLLVAIAFAPSIEVAIALLLGRVALSQMDVPTRQAYLALVVQPGERTAAAAYTNTARYATRPLAPLIAGAVVQGSLGAPFVIAGSLKSLYDVGLYAKFRTVDVTPARDPRRTA